MKQEKFKPGRTLLAAAALTALLSLQRVHAADEAPAKPEEAKPAASTCA